MNSTKKILQISELFKTAGLWIWAYCHSPVILVTLRQKNCRLSDHVVYREDSRLAQTT